MNVMELLYENKKNNSKNDIDLFDIIDYTINSLDNKMYNSSIELMDYKYESKLNYQKELINFRIEKYRELKKQFPDDDNIKIIL